MQVREIDDKGKSGDNDTDDDVGNEDDDNDDAMDDAEEIKKSDSAAIRSLKQELSEAYESGDSKWQCEVLAALGHEFGRTGSFSLSRVFHQKQHKNENSRRQDLFWNNIPFHLQILNSLVRYKLNY